MHEPKVSIITSIYNADDHMESFLEDITSQTCFEKCELVIVDGASPGNEFKIISKYQKQYLNIRYHKLEEDPGIYGCWNHAITNSFGEYITNANVDDRRAHHQIEKFVATLDSNPEVDLVYGPVFVTHEAHETFQDNSSRGQMYPTFPFTKEAMIKCLPGCQPLWRRSMHDKAGLFDDNYKFAGDWEMWLRAVNHGSKFMMIDEVCGLYYHNPSGLTTDPAKQREKFSEEKKVFWNFTDIFGPQITNAYKGYFSGT